ncbi:MAG TPA: MerC domain-containing protein [Rhodanobacteraceae bacterium]|nr:MerC domain-containing protein [Rhodanobacteraceae bacterium]
MDVRARNAATPQSDGTRRGATLVDRVGATASFACAVHCVALPFVLGLLPLIGLGFLASHSFERIFVVCAVLLASGSMLTAYRHHHRPQALMLMVPGIVLLVFGVGVDIDAHVLLHTASVVCGGVLVASAHVTNLALSHRHHRLTCTRAAA